MLLYTWYIAAIDGVVLATEKKQKSILYDNETVHKVEQITRNIGMVYSGMGPDYRYFTSSEVLLMSLLSVINVKKTFSLKLFVMCMS